MLLGNTNPRPVGITNHGWLPIGIVNNPLPDHLSPSNEWIQRRTSPDNQGSSRAAIQGCNPGDTTTAREFCVPDLPGRKERWWPEASGKSKTFKSVHEDRKKMEGLHLLPDLIQQGDWMIKLDLKDAYLQVPIHQDHQKFLVIEWNNLFYQFRCLPFGLSTAPRVFTKLLRPVVGFLRQIGCRLIIYLDDILLLHQDREQLLNISWLVNQLFQCLGLLINQEKSLQIPCLQMEYLGFLLSSQSLLISVPAEKMRKIQQDATKILSQDQVTCSSGASQICGESSSNSSGSPLGPPTLQSLTVSNKCSPPSPISGYGITESQKVQHKGAFARGEQGKFEMVEAAGQEENDIADPPTKTFSIDRIRCINQGLGAVLNSQTKTGGVWSVQEASNHIIYLELLAAFLALKAFGKSWTHLTVLLRMDNFTAVTYVNQKGALAPRACAS